MYILTQSQIQQEQQKIASRCKKLIFQKLDASNEMFQIIFPNAELVVKGEESMQKTEAAIVIDQQIKKIKKWVTDILDMGSTMMRTQEYEEKPIPEITLVKSVSNLVIKTLLQVFTCGRGLEDDDYYFINDVSSSMSMDPSDVHELIEQSHYMIRKDFFSSLLVYLSDEECRHCAFYLFKAIHADNVIHPAEFKYFENISQLLYHDQGKLDQLQKDHLDGVPLPKVSLNNELNTFLFKYLTEIVMCDGEYDANESKLLSDLAAIFGFTSEERENILQPVISTVMVKNSLFPKRKTD